MGRLTKWLKCFFGKSATKDAIEADAATATATATAAVAPEAPVAGGYLAKRAVGALKRVVVLMNNNSSGSNAATVTPAEGYIAPPPPPPPPVSVPVQARRRPLDEVIDSVNELLEARRKRVRMEEEGSRS